jgi:ABC-2 type transport system permease protein
VSSTGVGLDPRATPDVGPPCSAEDHRHGSTQAAMAGHAWGPLRREWTKLLFTRRTYVIWAGLLAIPGLITLALKLADTPPGPGEGPEFLSRVVGNGMYVPLASLAALLPFFLPLAAIMVASYMIAGEAELGTLRIVLLRPVDRGAMLVTKWVASITYLFVGLLIVVAGGLVFGAVFFGLEPLVTLSGSTVDIPWGIGLILLTAVFALAAMSCMISLALLFSTVTDSSLTALIATVVLYVVIQLLVSFSYFDWLVPYVFPTYFNDYVNLFRDPIAWRPIGKAVLVFGLWSAGLTTAAWLLFRRKDVLS